MPKRGIAIPVQVNLVTALVLRGVTGDVSRTHYAGHIGILAVNHDDADRATHRRKRVFPFEAKTLDRCTNSFGDFQRTIIAAALQENAEFIATQTRHYVRRADASLYQLRQLAQQCITGRMAKGVVDHLELIE